jgi:hypothetical protein
MMLALSCGLLWAGPAMSANEMRFSDLEARMAAVEQKTSAIPGLKSAAFLSDGDPIDAVAPNDAVQANGDEALSSPSVSHGTTCGCGTCGCGSTCDCSSECTCGDAGGCGCPNGCQAQNNGSYYAEIDMMFLRTHMMEDVAGKLSETYEFSPRFILGYETANGVGARMRYWTYGRTTAVLNAPDDIRFEFDVLDFEATARFKSCRSELVVAGGFRFASIDTEWDEESVGLDAPGITVAGDFRSVLCGECGREWAFVAGARWSILGGDWEGSDFGFVEPIRDDNLMVEELYAGAEYSCHYCNYVLFARLVFEMQNWHSDVLSQSAGVDSISLLGPGIHVGMAF